MAAFVVSVRLSAIAEQSAKLSRRLAFSTSLVLPFAHEATRGLAGSAVRCGLSRSVEERLEEAPQRGQQGAGSKAIRHGDHGVSARRSRSGRTTISLTTAWALAYAGRGEWDKAADSFGNAVRIAPEQPMYQMWYGVSLYEKAVKQARDDQARKENKKPEEIKVDLTAVNFEKAQQHLARGGEAQQGHVARALLPRPHLSRAGQAEGRRDRVLGGDSRRTRASQVRTSRSASSTASGTTPRKRSR